MKKLVRVAVMVAMCCLFPLFPAMAVTGDVNGNSKVEMDDAIMALRSAADIEALAGAGLDDAVDALQVLAGIVKVDGRALLGPLSGAEVNVYRLADLDTSIHTTQTGADGSFSLALSGVSSGEPVLVAVSGGVDTDADDDGLPDAAPTANAGTVYGLVFPGESGEFHVTAVSDIAWRYTENLAGEVDNDGLLLRMDDLARFLFIDGTDLNSDGKLDRKDVYAFDSQNSAHRAALNFDFQDLFAENGDGFSIINSYHGNRPDVLMALLEDYFGPRLTQAPVSDNRYDKVKIAVTAFGKGSVTGGGISVNTAGEEAADIADAAFFDQSATGQVVLTAAPTDETEILSWTGCDSVSADKTECVCDLKDDHDVSVTFGYRETQLKSGVTLVDLTDAVTVVGTDQVMLDVTAVPGDGDMRQTLAGIGSGDIVVSGSAGGFLRKVVSVQKVSDDNYILTTGDASLEEVIAQGTGTFYKQMTNGDLEDGGNARSGSSGGVQTAENVRMIPSDDPRDPVFRFELGNLRERGSLDGVLNFPSNDDAVLSVKGTVEVTVDVETGVSFGLFSGMEYFKYIPKITASESLEVTATAEVSTPSGDDAPKLKLATLPFTPITFFAGPVPIVIKPEVNIYLGIDAKAGGAITTKITFKQVARAGIVYNKNAGVEVVTEFTPTFDFTKPTGSVYVEAVPYVETGPAFYLYGLTGPEVTIKAYMKLRGEAELPFLDEPCSGGVSFTAHWGIGANWGWDLKHAEKLGKWATKINVGGTIYNYEDLIFKWQSAGVCGTLPPYMSVGGFDITETFAEGAGTTVQKQYTVTNEGDVTMDWEASWLEDGVTSVSPASGSLGKGQSATVTVSVNPSGLSIGDYHNEVEFNNLYDGGVGAPAETGSTSRNVDIIITPPPLASPVVAEPQMAEDGAGNVIFSKVILTWSYPDAATLKYVDGYAVWKSTDASNNDLWGLAASNVTGSTYTVANLLPNTTYYFAVDAYGKDVKTGMSGTVSITTPQVQSGGDTFTNSLGMTFVRIPAGSFMMGSPTDEPGRDSDETLHQVTLTQDFYMMTTEVTQSQWESVMGSNPSYFSACGGNCPVETVSWDDITQQFIPALNAMEGKTYRLPTEAEWEYAARGGSATAFANGAITHTGSSPVDPNLDAMGWYYGNSGDTTHPAAQKQANAYGLFDMHGNVYEWCQDWYGTYPSGSVTDPAGPDSASYRVLRGGSWRLNARSCRSANRINLSPTNRYYNGGFRLALSPGQ